MDTQQLREIVTAALDCLPGVAGVKDFEDFGIWSSADGLVVTLDDGAELQLSIVQTRYAAVSLHQAAGNGSGSVGNERCENRAISRSTPRRLLGCGECAEGDDR